MTARDFRRIALSFPEAVEQSHMEHPDFRVGGKIFATLGHPDAGWGMVALTAEQQAVFVQSHPAVFSAVPGGWGRRGATSVSLAEASAAIVREALSLAWQRRAPKRLLARLEST